MTAAFDDAMHALDAGSVLGLLPTRPRVLALGEPTHGEEVLLEVRNDLFRALVEHEGYRTITVESDCLLGLAVDDHVTSGRGDLDEVMARGFSHGWGESPGNRDLVRWMRAFNEGRPADDHVRFAGFDGPLEITAAASPRQVLTALLELVIPWVDADLLPCTAATLDELLGDDDRWTNPAAMYHATESVGQTPEAGQLRLIADDLAALVDEQAPALMAALSRDDWDRARLLGRTGTGLLRYHHWMADPGPGRLARLLGVRDSMMAANLLALAERGPTLVHAHNAHLQRERSSMRMGDLRPEWWCAGAIVSALLGEGYAVLHTALGTIRHQGVDTPPADTIEGLLYAQAEERCLVDPRRLAAALDGSDVTPRVSEWFGYAALDPAHLPSIDGLVFVKDSPPS